MTALFSLECSKLPPSTELLAFRGTEALNEPYEMALLVRMASADSFAPFEVVGERATLVIHVPDGDVPFQFHGRLVSAEQVRDSGGHALYKLLLVPTLWYAAQSSHCQVFVEQTVPSVLRMLLESEGISGPSVRFVLDGSYEARRHTCQYRESNLAFFTRLLEREGMHCYFEQGNGDEVLVVSDRPLGHTKLAARAVRYVPGGAGFGEESLTELRCRARAVARRVAVRDYDPLRPRLDVSGDAVLGEPHRGEINLHGDGMLSPEECTRAARLRSEALRAHAEIYLGRGRVFYLRSGYTFTLEEHPRQSFNRDYLVLSAEHQGNQATEDPEIRQLLELDTDDEYYVEVRAIPADVPYRPERITPAPRIYGMERAVVDGAGESDFAQLDEHGHYKVTVAFDEVDQQAGKASAWVRMMQPHGGSNEGFHFPLRKGTEVMLTFVGGDPDQPLIAGVVPNANAPSLVTSANATKNVIQTGGGNRIEMGDDEGQQYVKISCPVNNTYTHMGRPNATYTVHEETEGNRLLKTGQDFVQEIGAFCNREIGMVASSSDRSLTETVHGDVTEAYKDDHGTTVSNNRTVTVGGDYTRDVAGDDELVVDGKQTQRINSDRDIEVHGDLHETVKGTVTKSYKADYSTTVKGDRTETIGGEYNGTVEGDYNLSVKKAWEVNFDGKKWENQGGATGCFYGGFTMNIMAGLSIDLSLSVAIGLSVVDVGVTMLEIASTGLSVSRTSMKVEHDAVETSNVGCTFGKSLLSTVSCGLYVIS